MFHREQRKKKKRKRNCQFVNCQLSIFPVCLCLCLLFSPVPCSLLLVSLLYTALRLKDFLAELLPNPPPRLQNPLNQSLPSLHFHPYSHLQSLLLLLLIIVFLLCCCHSVSPSLHPPTTLHYRSLSLFLSISPPAVPDRRPFADRITNPTSHCLF